MEAVTLSKSEYAARVGVKPTAVSNWIRRGKLTAPALTPDGKIDVALADRQLPTVVRRAAPAPRRQRLIRRNPEASGDPPGGQPPVAADHAEAADLQLADRRHGRGRPPGDRHDQKLIGAFVVVDELPGLAQALRLDRGQVAALSRWFLGRRTA